MNNNLNENNKKENEQENKIKEELENQLKFWSEYELIYLFKNKNLTNYKNLLENNFKENLLKNSNLHSNYVLKYNTLDNKIIEYNLKHPTWSKTLFNFINDMISIEYNSNTNETQYLSDVYDIPLFQSHNNDINNDNDNDNDNDINNKNIINQTGNGVCHKTLELYCYFFDNFDFENEVNQSLITRIYTNSKNTQIFYNCYIFNDEDYLIQDINNFIKHFEFENNENNENNEKNIYKKIEIIQSLLCLSNFLDCNLLYSFSISKMITYLKEL